MTLHKFAIITDIHYDKTYAEQAPATCKKPAEGMKCCHKEDVPIPPYRMAQPYGDYNCDSSFALSNLTIHWLATQSLDFILWAGDTIDHRIYKQSFQYNLEELTTITNTMKQVLQVPIYPCIGNHDTFPVDQLCSKYYGKLFKSYYHLWGDWISSSSSNLENANTFLKYGYYSILIQPKLRLIVLNTLYDDTNNNLRDFCKEDSIHQLEWMSLELYQAKQNQETVWIMGHIPPISCQLSNTFIHNFTQFANTYTIPMSFWGHTHVDNFFLIPSENQDPIPVSIGNVVGSVEPDNHDPVVKIYTYDNETYELRSYQQYTVNLTLLNTNNNPHTITFEELMTSQQLGLVNLNSTNYIHLYQHFQAVAETDSDLFTLYYETSQYQPISTCDTTCRQAFIQHLNLMTTINCSRVTTGTSSQTKKGDNMSAVYIILYFIGLVIGTLLMDCCTRLYKKRQARVG